MYLGELDAELLRLLLRQARWRRVGWVRHGTLHGHVGQAVCAIHAESFVRRVQVDICEEEEALETLRQC